MAKYEVKAIDLNGIRTVEEYEQAIKKAVPHICNGLKSVWEYCGGKLRSMENGSYAGREAILNL